LSLGFEPVGGSSKSFAKYIQVEITKWDRVIKEMGTTVQ
jgi:tripartite-type tricarboxylate transporter receptor subunit TctC